MSRRVLHFLFLYSILILTDCLRFKIEGDTSLPLEGTPLVFIAFDGATSYTALSAVMAALFNQNSPVYVLTDDVDKFSTSLHMVGKCNQHIDLCSRVKIKNLKLFQNHDEENLLKKHYLHCSSNGFHYERSCFQRFFWLQQFMQKSMVNHALFLDADVLINANVGNVLGLSNTVSFRSLTTNSTYFSYWSLPILNKFCTYMQDFYDRPIQHVALDLAKYGDRSASAPLPAPGWPSGVRTAHFSDMYMLEAFLDHNPELVQFSQLLEKVPGWNLKGTWNMGLHFGKACAPPNWQDGVVHGYDVRIPKDANGDKLLGMHFQGDCKNHIQTAFAEILLHNPLHLSEKSAILKLMENAPKWQGRVTL